MDRGLCRLTALPLLPAAWLQCRQCDIHKPGTASGELCRCLSALAGIPAPAQLCASLLGPDTCAGGTPRRQIFGSVMPCCRDFPMFSISQTGWHCSQALCPASCHTESEIKLLLKAGKTSSTPLSAVQSDVSCRALDVELHVLSTQTLLRHRRASWDSHILQGIYTVLFCKVLSYSFSFPFRTVGFLFLRRHFRAGTKSICGEREAVSVVWVFSVHHSVLVAAKP